MRGILLAGGTGSRLFPLTRVVSQYLLPVGKYPMIFYPLERLKKAGIKQVLIVADREALGPIIGILGSGAGYGLELHYQVREKAPSSPGTCSPLGTCSPSGTCSPLGSLADLELALDFARGEPILVVLGNQIFRDDLSEAVAAFQNRLIGAGIFLKEVTNKTECAIAEIESSQLLRFRPYYSNSASNRCVTGTYMFDARVFELISELRNLKRRNLSGKGFGITEVLDIYLARGELGFQDLRDWWVEVETFETLDMANDYTQGVELEFNKV